MCLIVRREAEGIRRYAHIGTGNYNAGTSRIYTDLGLVTARREIVEDVTHVFNYLTGYSAQSAFNSLVVAPVNLRKTVRHLIEREAEHAAAGRPARIIIKINGLTDEKMIRHLYEASRAGTPIDLLVRGICCLRPGVPEASATIRVRSLVGRFLEHSRIFSFENGGHPETYIGSADLMERNLDRRVEVLCPIRDRELERYLREVVLDLYLRDNVRAWQLNSDGTYTRVISTEPLLDAQEALVAHHSADTASG